ncbi:hypothetical protein GCM10027404_07340 [Arthrobacter tumbae]
MARYVREPAILTERGNDALTTDDLMLMTGPTATLPNCTERPSSKACDCVLPPPGFVAGGCVR